MTCVGLARPRDLPGLARALARASAASLLVAGGTDLVLRLRGARERPDLLIDLSGLRRLSYVRRTGDEIRIGALTSFAQIEREDLLWRHARCLAAAAARVGSAQIRAMATLAGNVANGSSCADGIPALLALDAQACVLDADGQLRMRPVREVIPRDGEPGLGVREAIVEFRFRPLPDGQRSAFAKVGIRNSVAVARLNAALVIEREGSARRIRRARIAFGSIAPVAFLDEAVASTLVGQPLDSQPEAFADACAALVRRSIPERSSLPYKEHAVRGLAADLWAGLS